MNQSSGEFWSVGRLTSYSKPPKPRSRSLTFVLDKLEKPDIRPYLEYAGEYVDLAKIGWGLSLLVPRRLVEERNDTYREYGVWTAPGGTLLEVSEARGVLDRMLEELASMGFTHVEISSGTIDIPLERRVRLIHRAEAVGLRPIAEVGKKDPSMRMRLTTVLDEIGALLEAGAWKVVIEGRESGLNSCIFDERGDIIWDWVVKIASRYRWDKLVFEAPLFKQQVGLIRYFGPHVNLGNIRMEEVLSLESMRAGMRGDTFLIKPGRVVYGGPAAKYVYCVLRHFGPLTTSELVAKTGLPKRTVQHALKTLSAQGLVTRMGEGRGGVWISH